MSFPRQPPGVEEHDAAADAGEVKVHPEVLEDAVLRQDLLQAPLQCANVYQGQHHAVDALVQGAVGPQAQGPAFQAHDNFRGTDIHLVGLDFLAVLDLDDRHPGHPGEDLGEQAVGPGRHVLDQHKGHPGIDGQVLQPPGEGLQTAGGGADPHHLGTGGRVACCTRLAAGGSCLGDGGRGRRGCGLPPAAAGLGPGWPVRVFPRLRPTWGRIRGAAGLRLFPSHQSPPVILPGG